MSDPQLAEAGAPSPGAPVRTGRNSVLYLVGALMQGLGIFIVQPFALHVLNNDAKWQELFLSVSVIQVGVVLAAAGLPLAITKAWFDPGGHTKARAISGFLTLGGLVLGLLAGGACLLFASGLKGSTSFSIALVAMGLQASVLAAQAILRAQGRAVMFVVLSLCSSMAAYLGGLVAMLLFGAEASIFMTGYGFLVFLSAILSVIVARPVIPFTHPEAIREAVAIGVPVLPHTGALMLLTQGAPFLLAVVAVSGVSGDYGKVQIFVLGSITLLGALNNAWVPALMSVRGEDRVRRMRSTMTTASLAGLAIVVAASSGANLVVHVMAGGKESLIPVAQIMPLIALGYLLYLNASTLLFADNVTWWLSVVTPAVLVASGALALWPAREGNLEGVALVSVISFLLLGLAYLAVAWRRAAGGWALGVYALCWVVGVAYVGVLLLLPTDVVTGLATVGVAAVIAFAGAVLWRIKARRSAARA
ncbi:O-antigen/teichoic acid export membrane protein [Arthrobacter woluwensis]|uniref:hypothetical protein n=1 Tax=Arthrobacter woluwensis TaxID=156980 RepID=UPI002784B33D|nr:hypothetical protein [Arthrobacter woluwensis]MDQ0709367.1 O-antigen/teichoic acid export membrane protein [Arthrobacter woluwensis]